MDIYFKLAAVSIGLCFALGCGDDAPTPDAAADAAIDRGGDAAEDVLIPDARPLGRSPHSV